jgi:acetyl-CoA/propionyl-CoA carboxylase biotin carboxyl carrier protein
MFDRVLIANRGEIVIRIARTLRRLGCSPAAVHASGDPALAALRACDVTARVGSYLDVGEIVEAARRVGAQAIHPGYGFLSERAELARACAAAGLVWIGPPAAAIELMGDKSRARDAALRAGVPVVPGIADPTPSSVAEFAREHGLPLIVKAAAGGGGKGMRLVRSLDELVPALEGAAREAASAFGDAALLVERLIAPARHLELQVLADGHGTVIDLGERECSLQRRHQKVIEETPSVAVDGGLRAALAREGVALAHACGYVGAGTVEFVAHAEDPARHYFLEMNTRLQVEHAITEVVHGVDLVEWQVRIAAGERIEGGLGAFVGGHAVEARVYAEDPARGFLPAAGTVRALALPRGRGIRVDAGIAPGETIGTRYDPMIAKVIAHGATRDEALARLRAALRDTAVLGVHSNVGFLCELLADERVRAGAIDTALVERLAPAPDGERARRAALAALIARQLSDRDNDADVFARLPGFRLAGPAPLVRHLLTVDGEREVEVALGPLAGAAGAPSPALLDGEPVAVALRTQETVGAARRLRLSFDGVTETWTAVRDGDRWWAGCDGRAWLLAPSARERGGEIDGERDLRAPMPGSIVAIHVHEGAEVERGDVVLVMESMKMELQITAPRAGTIAELHVAAGDQVALDTLLASIAAPQPLAAESAAASAAA